MIWKHFCKCESKMLTIKTQENAISHLLFVSFLFFFFHIFPAIFCVNIYPLFPLPTYTWYLLQAVFFSITIIYFSHWNALRFQKEKPIYIEGLINECYIEYYIEHVINLNIPNKYFFRFFFSFLKKGKNLSFQASHRFHIVS